MANPIEDEFAGLDLVEFADFSLLDFEEESVAAFTKNKKLQESDEFQNMTIKQLGEIHWELW